MHLAAALYLLAFAAGLPAMIRGRGTAFARRFARLTVVLMFMGFAVHTASMVVGGLCGNRCPIEGAADVLQIATWSLVVMYAVVGAAFRTSLLGLFTSGLAALLCFGSFFAGPPTPFPAAEPVVLAHAWLSLFSYGGFGLLALTGLMYLIQHHGLRARRWAPLFELLPSLRELERVGVRLLVVSSAVYTVACAMGLAWFLCTDARVSGVKLLMASIVWAGYAAALILRLLGRLGGRALAYAGVVLFALALATLYPVRHGYAPQPDEAQPSMEAR